MVVELQSAGELSPCLRSRPPFPWRVTTSYQYMPDSATGYVFLRSHHLIREGQGRSNCFPSVGDPGSLSTTSEGHPPVVIWPFHIPILQLCLINHQQQLHGIADTGSRIMQSHFPTNQLCHPSNLASRTCEAPGRYLTGLRKHGFGENPPTQGCTLAPQSSRHAAQLGPLGCCHRQTCTKFGYLSKTRCGQASRLQGKKSSFPHPTRASRASSPLFTL